MNLVKQENKLRIWSFQAALEAVFVVTLYWVFEKKLPCEGAMTESKVNQIPNSEERWKERNGKWVVNANVNFWVVIGQSNWLVQLVIMVVWKEDSIHAK